MKRAIFYPVILLIAFGLILGICKATKRNVSSERIVREARPSEPAEPNVVKDAKVKEVKGEIDIKNAFIKVAEKVGKSVVAISTERTQRVGVSRPRFRARRFGGPFTEEDPFERFFEDFFGQYPEREFKQRGLGSGFVIDSEGHILTNYHVIEGAEKINITLSDGRTFLATVKGADPRSDLAIIKVEEKDLPAVELGNSDLIQTGEWVVALGNPFGHVLKSPEPTVTVGVVSALHRHIPTPGGESGGYLDMIQTDAAINPGNSGGPLCDLDGNVIGINVVIFSTSGGYQGMGFAIPINVVKDVLSDLLKGKEITYGWLGVAVQEITPDIAEYFNLQGRKGALISQVIPESPAEKAGLKEGDIVKAFNGKEVNEVNDLLKEVGQMKIDQIAYVDIIRDRIEKRIEVKIGKRPSKVEFSEGKEFMAPEEAEKWRGMKVAEITDEIAGELGLKDKEGLVIIEVEQGSPSYKAGLREGDVLREINRTKIRNIADYKRITGEAGSLALLRTDSGYFTVKEK